MRHKTLTAKERETADAIARSQRAQYKEVIKHMKEGLFVGVEVGPAIDSCDSCWELGRKMYRAADLPRLPNEDCEHEVYGWCRCTYLAVVDKVDTARWKAQEIERINWKTKQKVMKEISTLLADGSLDALESAGDLLKRSDVQLHWAEYRDLAKGFAKIESPKARDQAWSLYNRALVEAMKESAPTYTIRHLMGKQLLKEGRTKEALHPFLRACWEYDSKLDMVKVPKYLAKDLRKALDLLGQLPLEPKLLKLARRKGPEKAVEEFDQPEEKSLWGRLLKR